MSFEQKIFIIYLCILGFISIITILLYGIDKKKAEKGKNRIKESYLLGLSAFGGAIGAFLGRIIFHHKTDKIYFSITIYLSILIEALATAFIVYVAFVGVNF